MRTLRDFEAIGIWKDCHENGKPFYVVVTCDKKAPHIGFRMEEFKLLRDAMIYAKRYYPNAEIWREMQGYYLRTCKGVD